MRLFTRLRRSPWPIRKRQWRPNITARATAAAAAATAEQATASMDEAFQAALSDDMKADPRYAESAVNNDNDQLKRMFQPDFL